MVASFEMAFLTMIVGLVSAFSLALIWIYRKAKKQLEVEGCSGDLDPYIPMPEHLKTHDQMVSWMTGEMPRLTAELIREKP